MSTAPERQYYVYIMTNGARTLYVGVTNNLVRRVYEHKEKLVPGFATRYNVTWLAYYEQTSDIASAIAREKQIKGWRRSKKVELIESMNPRWKDLALEWYEDARSGI
jgi:putative endonuclease